MSTTGERIKNRRLELGMTQDELAQKAGYTSRSTIAKLESGDRNLSQPQIKALADALKTTPSYIMGWEDSEYSSKAEELLAVYQSLSQEDQKLVDNLLLSLSQKKE